MSDLIDFPENPIKGDFYIDPSGDGWEFLGKGWRIANSTDRLNMGFISVWNVTSSGDFLALPLVEGQIYNFTVDWGDGNTDQIISWNQTETLHQYADAGEYTISINGVFPTIDLSSSIYASNLIKVMRLGNVGWKSFDSSFSGCVNLNYFEINITDTTSVISARNMFENCVNLTKIVLPETFILENVTDMSGMFKNSGIISVDFQYILTDNVTTMMGMFEDSGIVSFDFSQLNISSLLDSSYMFANTDISSVDLRLFNGLIITNASYMFLNTKIETLVLLNFPSATNLEGMFADCSELVNIDVSLFDFSLVQNISDMFMNNTSVFYLDLTNIDFSSVINASGFLQGNTQLKTLILNGITTTNVLQDISYFIQGCSVLENFDVVNFDTSNVSDMSYMMDSCVKLNPINFDTIDIGNLLDGTNMMRYVNLYSNVEYDELLIAWSAQTVQPNVVIHFGDARYYKGANRDILTNSPNLWIITDGTPYLFYSLNASSLINGGAEHGDFTAWVNELGDYVVYDESYFAMNPKEGLYFFRAGSSDQDIMRNRYDILDSLNLSSAEELDVFIANDEVYVDVSWWAASVGGANDTGGVGIRYLDENQTEISISYPEIKNILPTDLWSQRRYSSLVPVGTRYVDIICNSIRFFPIGNDAFYDDIISNINIVRSSVPIINAGADTGDTTGWTVELGTLRSQANGSQKPNEGTHYFTGANTWSCEASQRFNFSTLGLTEVDTEAYKIKLTWFQESIWITALDSGALGIRFLDSGQSQISKTYSPLENVEPVLTWKKREFEISVPAGARYFDIIMRIRAATSNTHYTRIDSISAYIY